jgi:nitroreductase
MPKPVVSREVLADAVHLACRAPSLHNSQPWRFVGDAAGVLHLFVDHDRLVDTDSSGRQALISCGAVLDHLRVATAAAGWVANVEYHPNPNDPTHLASIDFIPMSFVTDAHRRRAGAIRSRYTDRLPFAAPDDWDHFEPVLRDAVGDDLALLDVLPETARPRLAEASRTTESHRRYDSFYHAELAWWTGQFESMEGIPHSSLLSSAESERVDIARTFPVAHHRERRAQVTADHSRVLVLSALGDTRSDLLTCGEALSVVLLEATMAGLATCPLTHMTELEASRDMIGTLTGRPLPQVLIRVGEAPANEEVAPPTPRRPLRDVLTWKSSIPNAAH